MRMPGPKPRHLQTLRSGGKAFEKPLAPSVVVSLLAAHVALSVAFKYSAWVATIHALATFGLALYWGTRPERPELSLLAITYIASCEVLWRMADLPPLLTWEFGKQAVILLIAVAMFRRGSVGRAWAPWAYFFLLLPAAVVTLFSRDLSSSRQLLSADLSGPLAIALCLAFFLGTKVTPVAALNCFLVALAPIVGIAFQCYSGSFGADDIVFGDSSNFDASGGFGPNQVSATLAFGILCLWLCNTSGFLTWRLRIGFIPLALWFAVQSALTFSRTGLYLGALCCLAASWPMFRSLKTILVAFATAATLVLIFVYAVFPAADAFTGGKLSNRFQKVEGGGREDIMLADLKIWAHNPVLGVGVGQSYWERRAFLGHAARSHTEYTRLLAEHGFLGLVAGVVLIAVIFRTGISATGIFARSVSAGCLLFGLLFMVPSATRLVLPAVAFALGVVTLAPRLQGSARFQPMPTRGRSSLLTKRPRPTNVGYGFLRRRPFSIQPLGKVQP